jgi:hypothetical protein
MDDEVGRVEDGDGDARVRAILDAFDTVGRERIVAELTTARRKSSSGARRRSNGRCSCFATEESASSTSPSGRRTKLDEKRDRDRSSEPEMEPN